MRYLVLSPDGMPLEDEPSSSLRGAEAVIKSFAAGLRWQGYYFDHRRRRIPLDELHEYCQVVGVGDGYFEDGGQ